MQSIGFGVYVVDRASAPLRGVGNAFDASSGKARMWGNVVKTAAKGVAIGLAATLAAGAGFAKMAAEDDASARQLAVQLHNAAGATKAQTASVEEWIDTTQRATGVADDDLRPALAKLVSSTGDVGTAQDQLKIALDASAGSGKSLETITMGLVRANNGSVAGLSRLGVKTKDAAGETLSLGQVTQNLANLYKGQASAAANTAFGQYERLKIMLSETGETIGYKLLPIATSLGNWLLGTGVPAVEKFGGYLARELGPVVRDLSTWIRTNKDEFAAFGREVGDNVIGTIKGLADTLGPVADFIGSIPDPLRNVGLEAGIAALALWKVAPALTSIGVGAGGAVTKLTTLNAAMLTTSLRSGTLGRGLLGVAGVGGMVAIEEGSRRGSKAVSVLGAAMSGAFVGGTIGSAIPGVGTAIGAVGGAAVAAGISMFRMSKQTDDAAGSAEAAKVPFEAVADTLDQVSGAATRATRQMILQKLQQDEIISASSQLGIATSDLIKASLGNQKAIGRVNDAWTDQSDLLDGLQNQKITSWVTDMRMAYSNSRKAIKDANAAIDGTDKVAKKASRALGDIGGARPQTNKWTALYLGDINKATGRTRSYADDMRTSLATTPGKARTNMATFSRTLYSQLTNINGGAYSSGTAIGRSIESGVKSGLGGLISSVVNTVQAAINAARARAAGAAAGAGAGGGGGARKSGRTVDPDALERTLGKGKGGGKKPPPGVVLLPGAINLLESIAVGIDKVKKPGDRVLDLVKQDFEDKRQKVQELRQASDEFAKSFKGWATSIFSIQSTDEAPLTVQSLLAAQRGEQQKSGQVLSDVQQVLRMGLSKDLVEQLQANGAQGIEALHVLAQSNQDQINQFNASNSATQANYAAAGMAAASKVYDGDIAQAQAQANLSASLVEAISSIKNLERVEFIVKGDDLVAVLKKKDKDKGKDKK